MRYTGNPHPTSGNTLSIVSKIRPEQMSHSKFLRRGRNLRALHYAVLILAALAAAAGVWAAFALPGLAPGTP